MSYPMGRPTKFCHACASVIDLMAVVCPQCGVAQASVALLEQSAPEVVAKLNVAASRVNDLLKDENRRAIATSLVNFRFCSASSSAFWECIASTWERSARGCCSCSHWAGSVSGC